MISNEDIKYMKGFVLKNNSFEFDSTITNSYQEGLLVLNLHLYILAFSWNSLKPSFKNTIHK